METRRSLPAVIAAMAVVNLVYSLTLPLLALVLADQGVDSTLIGVSTMVQAAAGVAVAPLAPGLMVRLGPARLMQLATLAIAAGLLLLPALPGLVAWLPLRFAIGAAAALLWVASEATINELADDARRGRIIAVYSSAGAAGFALGPLILVMTGSDGWLPFIVASALILAAAVPLALATDVRSAAPRERPPGMLRMVLLAPAIVLANFAFAAATESFGTFFPLFGLSLGLAEPHALGLMTVAGLGGIVLVLPLGWLADRVDRMVLMVACVAGSILGLLVMPQLVGLPLAGPAYLFLLGGVQGMIYTLGVTLMGERFRGAALAAASTAFTAMWGMGTVVGPPLVGFGMDRLGAGALPYLIAFVFALYLPVALLARRRGRTLSSLEKEAPS